MTTAPQRRRELTDSRRKAGSGHCSSNVIPVTKALKGQKSGIARKVVAFEPETWAALDLLARDSMKTFQELAEEAFRDLLKSMAARMTCGRH